MPVQYQYVKIGRPFYCLQQSPVVLAWLLYFKYETLRLHSLKIDKKQGISALRALVRHQLHLGSSDSVLELPAYGNLCLPVHRGYRVFDFRRKAVTRTFDPEVDRAIVENEIEGVRQAGRLDFAPAVPRWNEEERWYEEEYVIGDRARWIPKSEPEAVVRIYRQHVAPCLEHMILLQAPVNVKLGEYVGRIMDSLGDGRLSKPGLNVGKAMAIRDFVESVAEHLLLEGSGTAVDLVFSHGDFSLRNMLRTRDGMVVIDWESAGRRSALFDLYNYFFTESYYGRITTDLISEISEAISSLQSRLTAKAPSIASTLCFLAGVYCRLYTLERVLALLERELSDDLLDVILRSIEVFARYEKAKARQDNAA
jgi:hypothetical protein